MPPDCLRQIVAISRCAKHLSYSGGNGKTGKGNKKKVGVMKNCTNIKKLAVSPKNTKKLAVSPNSSTKKLAVSPNSSKKLAVSPNSSKKLAVSPDSSKKKLAVTPDSSKKKLAEDGEVAQTGTEHGTSSIHGKMKKVIVALKSYIQRYDTENKKWRSLLI